MYDTAFVLSQIQFEMEMAK